MKSPLTVVAGAGFDGWQAFPRERKRRDLGRNYGRHRSSSHLTHRSVPMTLSRLAAASTNLA